MLVLSWFHIPLLNSKLGSSFHHLLTCRLMLYKTFFHTGYAVELFKISIHQTLYLNMTCQFSTTQFWRCCPHIHILVSNINAHVLYCADNLLQATELVKSQDNYPKVLDKTFLWMDGKDRANTCPTVLHQAVLTGMGGNVRFCCYLAVLH